MAGVVGGLLALVAVAVLLVTSTDWGRERVRLFGVRQLAELVNGDVTIGRVRGNLLTGATLEDVEITDAEGRLFLRADTVSLEYSMRSLFQKHLVFTDLRVVRPTIVLDQPPGERWNFERLFPDDSLTAAGDTIPGFGDWVRLEDVTLVDGTIAVLRTVDPEAAERPLLGGLVPADRQWIVSAPGGQQAASYFYDVDAELPLLRLADPDSAARLVQIASLSTIAMPFQPPAASIRNLSGQITIWEDTLGFTDLDVALPHTALTLDGFYAFGAPSGLALELDAERLAFADLRWLRPSVPAGGGSLVLAVRQSGGETRVAARDVDLRVDGGTVAGFAEIATGPEGTRVEASDLRFTDVDTRTVEGLLDGVEVPFDGTASGEVRLAGVADDLDVDGWARITERGGATSLVEADGRVLNRPGGVVADGLALRFDPLHMSLAGEILPEVPVDGSLTGTATLDGPLDGLLRLDADVVHRAPGTGRSRILARGGVATAQGGTARGLALRFDPLTTDLARVFVPDLPLGGTITGRATVDGTLDSTLDVDADLVHLSGETGRSRILADGRIGVRDGLTTRGLELRFDPLTTALARVFLPTLTVDGTIEGTATVTGSLAGSLDVDADLVHEAAETGRSRVLADGTLLLGGATAARGLAVRMDPLQMGLARALGLDVPVEGTLTGRATLNGTLAERVSATDVDVTHVGPEGTSTFEGRATLAFADGLSAFDLDLVTRPVSLGTVGRFVPALGLRGSARGRVVASGTPASARVDATLEIAGGGFLSASGRVGLGATAGYDLDVALADFDAAAVSTLAPLTSLTGTATVRGVGTEPATANAFVDVALVDSRVAGAPGVDSTRVTARLADGLATIERGLVQLASATARVEGTFGLVESRTGELRYAVAVDTLSHFGGLVPDDPGVVPPRPLPRARELALARADSARTAEDSLVASLATHRAPPPPVPLDTVPALPRDSVSGSLTAEGVLVGNLTRFAVNGSAHLENVVLSGTRLGTGDVRYALADVRVDSLGADVDATVEADLEDVQVAGFAFTGATATLEHRGGLEVGSGALDVELVQDEKRDYRLAADYTIDVDRKELLLEEMALRFDTTTWASTGPGVVRWAGGGIEVEHIELVSEQGGRVWADGRLPDEGSGDLRLEVDSVQVAQLAALLQDTLETRGRLSLDATVRGTTRAPFLEGTLALDSLVRAGYALPDLTASFRYEDRSLVGEATLTGGGRSLLTADLRVPVDLAFTERTGPLLLDAPIEVEVLADSLPLAGLPTFTEAIQAPAGWVRGSLSVRGTTNSPELSGALVLADGSVSLPAVGLDLQDAVGSFRLAGDLVYVDSLVAWSDGGPIRADGLVVIETLTAPELDLEVTTRDALVLANERGTVRADAGLDVEGPLDALVVIGDVHVLDGEIAAPEPDERRRATALDDPFVMSVLDTLDLAPPLSPGMAILESMHADLEVRIERDTWLRNSALNLEVYTPADGRPLHVTTERGVRTLALEGVIHTDRGQYEFAGRSLEITTGSVSFLGLERPDPLLQLSAQHEVPRPGRQTLTILINVGGYLSRPRIALSSTAEPPLPESDLLSYLAFGRESGSLFTGGGSGILGDALGGLGVLAEQQLAGLATGVLTDELFATIEQAGTQEGPEFDVFRVRTTTLPDEIAFGSNLDSFLQGIEIEAGEYLGPFYVATRVRPTFQSVPGLWGEYRTPSGFFWTASWQARYLPTVPTLEPSIVQPTRVFGTFFFWQKRF